ncbi:SDR family oxidoreductase [Streptomyces sp. DSM 44915]|uniref:SDR family oxidoreductase n=1 Tax=Streptomyces chisholmiae TaxID=3075540 RepID=A0ABU2JUW3_9ACTN|nr:SDR family oxidoreductase [Streptomyces sp. DSM 44915]MDT0268745.1 SDR family oxidoreductase [Streptomyces sp. DSM 44915]
MSTRTPAVVLITGCSSGIGHALALRAVRAGFTTVATSRNTEALGPLAAAGCDVRRLDVTDDAERRLVVKELTEEYGGVDVLVNNAGYGELGPLEEVPLDRWEAQFRTNVFGPVGLIQLVLPGMRERGRGRIVNVSSMAGELVLPVGAAYHGSKYALEAATEVLRLEVRRFGIGVSLVQPGAVNSRWGENVPALKEYEAGPYGDLVGEMAGQMAERLPRGVTPERVAEIVLRAVTARRPRARYRAGVDAHVLLALRRALSSAVWTRCVHTKFPSLRRPGPVAPVAASGAGRGD